MAEDEVVQRYSRLISFRRHAPSYEIRSITSSWINYEFMRENVRPRCASATPLVLDSAHMLRTRLCKQTTHVSQSLIQI